jgi:hypothetical protein
MIHIKKISFVSLIFLISFCKVTYADHARIDTTNMVSTVIDTSEYYLRFAGGLGKSWISFGALVFVRADINYTFISIRASSASKLLPDSDSPSPSVYDISLLAGLSYTTRLFYASFGLGIGRVSSTGSIYNSQSTYPGDRYIEKHDTGIGFPMQADLFWTPSSSFGLGIVFYSNNNSYTNFNGFVICIQFGKLR